MSKLTGNVHGQRKMPASKSAQGECKSFECVPVCCCMWFPCAQTLLHVSRGHGSRMCSRQNSRVTIWTGAGSGAVGTGEMGCLRKVWTYVGAKWGVGVREPVQIETRMGPFCVHRGRAGRVQKTRGSRDGWVRRYDEDAEACCNFCE